MLSYLFSDEAEPHTLKTFFVVCGSAFFVGATSAKGSRRRRDAKPFGNTGKHIARARRSSPGSSCGPLPYLLRPFSYSLPGQAPGCRPAIRKRANAVSEKPQEAGRADASRSLYCSGGMLLCRFTSRWMSAGNYKLSNGPPRRQALFLPAGSFFLCYFPFFSGEEGK